MKLLKFILLLCILINVLSRRSHKRKRHIKSHHHKHQHTFLQVRDDDDFGMEEEKEALHVNPSDKETEDLEEKLNSEVEKYNQSLNADRNRITSHIDEHSESEKSHSDQAEAEDDFEY